MLECELLDCSDASANAELEAFASLQASGLLYPDDIWNFNLLLMGFHKSGLKSSLPISSAWENGFKKMWGGRDWA
jgi:hypothetical protein